MNKFKVGDDVFVVATSDEFLLCGVRYIDTMIKLSTKKQQVKVIRSNKDGCYNPIHTDKTIYGLKSGFLIPEKLLKKWKKK